MTRPGPKTHGDDDSGLVKRTFWITHRQNAQLTTLPPYTKSDVVRLALQQFFGDTHATLKTPSQKAPAHTGQDTDDDQVS